MISKTISKKFLLNFINVFYYSQQKKLSKFRLENLDNRDDSTDAQYWKKYEDLINPKKEKLWDAMLYSLQKYQFAYKKLKKNK